MSHRPFQFVASILSATFLIASVGCGTYGLDTFGKDSYGNVQTGEEFCMQQAAEYWDSIAHGEIGVECVEFKYVEGDDTTASGKAIVVLPFLGAAAAADVQIEEGAECKIVPVESAACVCANTFFNKMEGMESLKKSASDAGEEWDFSYEVCSFEDAKIDYENCLCPTMNSEEYCLEIRKDNLICEYDDGSAPAGPPPPGMESGDSSGAFTMSVQVSPTEIDSQPLSTDDLIEHLTGPSAPGVYWAPGTDGAAYQGVYLSYLNASSPLRQMGLRSQDVVTHLNGIKVNNEEALVSALSLVHENSVARMRILREDEVLRVRYDFR